VASNAPNLKTVYRTNVVAAIRLLMRKHAGDCEMPKRFHCLSEAIRMHSQGNLLVGQHLGWGALQGCIADFMWQHHEIAMRVVDTRQWKSSIVGTSKPAPEAPTGVDPAKWPTIQYLLHEEDVPKETLRLDLPPRTRNYTWLESRQVPLRTHRGKYKEDITVKCTYDDNIADAICIALYGITKDVRRLKFF